MKNENRAVFDRGPEPIDYAFELPVENTGDTDCATASARKPNLFVRGVNWLAARFRRGRNAMALQELSDEQLKDIGISRCQAYGGYSRYRKSSSHSLERRCR